MLGRSIPIFWRNLEEAINNGSNDRIKDYLVFLYSRLLALNENRKMSLRFLYEQERELIREELVPQGGDKAHNVDYLDLERFCDDQTVDEHASIVTKFNKKYLDILESEDGTRARNRSYI